MRNLLVLILLTIVVLGCATAQHSKNVPFEADYKTYHSILREAVDGELVDYAKLKENRTNLDNFIDQLASLSFNSFRELPKDDQKALWINAYNGITLRSIIDEYPVKSIRDIDGVWDEKKWLVAGKEYTLDEIEHKILRPQFNDGRIHFAVNCASIGCPPLLEDPFLPDSLEEQLDFVSQFYVNHPTRAVIDVENSKLKVTEIFSWFGEDFIGQFGEKDSYADLSSKEAAIVSFFYHYANDETRAKLDSINRWDIEYLEYDWILNDK